jgi:hypothetical protein
MDINRNQILPLDLFASFLVVSYILFHYALIFLSSGYGSSPLDELYAILLFPFAAYRFVSNPNKVLLLYISFVLISMLGAVVSHVELHEPLASAAAGGLLDLKLPIFICAAEFYFSKGGNKEYFFRYLILATLVVGIMNMPFSIMDEIRGADIFGDYLMPRGPFFQPQGLCRNPTELAWLFFFSAIGSFYFYKTATNTLFLMLGFLFSAFLLSTLAIKETLALFIAIGIIFIGGHGGVAKRLVAIAVALGLTLSVLYSLDFTDVIFSHVGQFVGGESIETVRVEMFYASLDIARKYFPLGSGSGTFGSAPSFSDYYSYLYYRYNIDQIYGGSPDYPAFLMDSTWSKIIGESGVFGTASFVLFFVINIRHMASKLFSSYKYKTAQAAYSLSVTVLILTVSIASSPFTNEITIFFLGIALGWTGVFGKPQSLVTRSLARRHLIFRPHRAGMERTRQVTG